MKKSLLILIFVFLILSLLNSCRESKKEHAGTTTAGVEETTAAGLIKIGTGIITEVYTKPDLTGDPWEVEKIKGFNGDPMFLNLLGKIDRGAIKVYDCLTEEELSIKDAKKILSETGSDISRIGKIQFYEDWYFNPSNNEIIKKVKSVSFGYESKRGEGLPPAYTPYFQIRPE